MASKMKDVYSILRERLNPISRNVIFAFQRTRDDWFWRQLYSDKKRSWIIAAQKLDPAAHIDYGPDLATAKFVVGRCGGKVRDERGIWLSKSRDLPRKFVESFKITAIDASDCKLVTEGIDNFAGLEHLQSLDLSRNKSLDDFACDLLSREFRFSKTLETIDLSYNDQISIHGLNVLFRIPSIKHIRAVETPASRHHEKELFSYSAEDERNCQITFDCLRLESK